MDYFNDQTDWSCHAFASRHVVEEDGKMRSGIEFEVYHTSKVMAFLKKDNSFPLNSTKEKHLSLLNHYIEHGAENEAFQKEKLDYFGDESDIYYFTVWFNEPAETDQINITEWYLLKRGDRFDCEIVPFLDDESITKTQCTIHLIEEDDKSALKKLMNIESINSKTLALINDTSKFFGALLYYVGAGLCVGVYTARYSQLGAWLPERPMIYFDFGYKSGSSSVESKVRANAPKAISNLEKIKRELIESPRKTIFISHFHSDHISMYKKVRTDEFEEFWKQSTWYVPKYYSPSSIALCNRIEKNGGVLVVKENVFPAKNQLTKLNGNKDFQYGKTDCYEFVLNPNGTSKDIAENHPHHHGIYAKVNLIDLSNRESQQLLLVGDTTYYGIPDIAKNNCSFLQACHHGGNYALPPYSQNLDVNKVSIPVPKADDSYGYALYSANGVTHGHPNGDVVRRHVEKGWKKSLATYLSTDGQLWVTFFDVK